MRNGSMKRGLAMLCTLWVTSCAHDTSDAEYASESAPFRIEEEPPSMEVIAEPTPTESLPDVVDGVVFHDWVARKDLFKGDHCKEGSASIQLYHRDVSRTNPCDDFRCVDGPGEIVSTSEYDACPTPDGGTMQGRGYSSRSPRYTYIRFPRLSPLWHRIHYGQTLGDGLKFDIEDYHVIVWSSRPVELVFAVFRRTGSCVQSDSLHERYTRNIAVFEDFAEIQMVHRLEEYLHEFDDINAWWFSPVHVTLTGSRDGAHVDSTNSTDFFDRTACYAPQDVETVHDVKFPVKIDL